MLRRSCKQIFFDECAICIREAFKAWKRCEFEFWCTLTQSLKITQKCLIYYNLRATIMLRILITISQIGCKFQVGNFMVIWIHCEFLEYWFWIVKLSSTRQPLEPFADAILVFFQCYQTKPDKCGLAALMWRLRECNYNCCVYTRIDFSYKRWLFESFKIFGSIFISTRLLRCMVFCHSNDGTNSGDILLTKSFHFHLESFSINEQKVFFPIFVRVLRRCKKSWYLRCPSNELYRVSQ